MQTFDIEDDVDNGMSGCDVCNASLKLNLFLKEDKCRSGTVCNIQVALKFISGKVPISKYPVRLRRKTVIFTFGVLNFVC